MRCWICDAESLGLSDNTPFKSSRKFEYDKHREYLDICSDCIDAVYERPEQVMEDGDIPNLEPIYE